MIIAGKYQVPDECPGDCPDWGCPYGQNSLCFRCPILNCKPFEALGGEPLLRPEDYREEWAKAFQEWFDGGMQGLPDLRF